ncbi:MAG: Na+/H+ antiporter subunit E [Mogibacterium sp.]|nr:Na+/H+ antiporter subunit E [Mogibacterium sp.]
MQTGHRKDGSRVKKDRKLQSNQIINWIQFIVLLLALWFILSGIFELKFIAYGVCTCLIISFICLNHLTIKKKHSSAEYFILHLYWPRLIVYFLWLFKEIINAALYVSKVVLFQRDKLDPHIIWFRADYKNPVASVLLANSITITPGTVTVDILPGGIFAVHALTDELAEGLADGGMQKKVAKAFGENIEVVNLEYVYDESLAEPKYTRLKKTKFSGRAKSL